jgi:hypothetical protein
VAGIINAIGVTMFIAPVQLYDSGISGTSILLSQLTPPELSLSLFLLILNITLFLYGLKRQGPVFTIYAIYAVAVYSTMAWVVTDVLPLDVSVASPLAGQDLLLCAIFGGLISGTGSGLAARSLLRGLDDDRANDDDQDLSGKEGDRQQPDEILRNECGNLGKQLIQIGHHRVHICVECVANLLKGDRRTRPDGFNDLTDEKLQEGHAPDDGAPQNRSCKRAEEASLEDRNDEQDDHNGNSKQNRAQNRVMNHRLGNLGQLRHCKANVIKDGGKGRFKPIVGVADVSEDPLVRARIRTGRQSRNAKAGCKQASENEKHRQLSDILLHHETSKAAVHR